MLKQSTYINKTNRTITTFLKKSLKIPKGQSESVYRRRTDNTMALIIEHTIVFVGFPSRVEINFSSFLFSPPFNFQTSEEKVQKDKQRSRKYTHKTKDRVT
jgi:hypothetical protein